MSQEKYIGMDVHQATISVAVMNVGGKLIQGMPAGDQGGHRWLSSWKDCMEQCR